MKKIFYPKKYQLNRSLLLCYGMMLCTLSLDLYTASALISSAQDNQELINKIIDGQKLSHEDLSRAEALRERLRSIPGVTDPLPAESDIFLIANSNLIENSFDSIKHKGTVNPDIKNHLQAVLSILNKGIDTLFSSAHHDQNDYAQAKEHLPKPDIKEAEEQIPHVENNHLLIFLDASEQNQGPVTKSLTIALKSKNLPIIAASFLLKKSQEELLSHYIIKEIDKTLYLLLPKKYLDDKKIDYTAVEKKVVKSNSYTELEYTLGVKVNHMETRELSQIDSSKEFVFAEKLSDIFITKQEYLKNKKEAVSFVFFIIGHGETEKSIIGISLAKFKLFLDFLRGIKVKLLYYISCFAAGKNTEILFMEKKDTHATYDFPIVTNAIHDDIIIGRFKENIFTCFEQATKGYDIDYAKASSCTRDGIEIFEEKGAAQIRPAGLPYFFVLQRGSSANAFSITDVMAKTRKEPLKITGNPVVIAFKAEVIPFKIVINTKKEDELFGGQEYYMPLFASLLLGKSSHYIEEIETSVGYPHEILKAFLGKYVINKKLFFIKKITLKDQRSLENCLVDIEHQRFFFMENKHIFISKASKPSDRYRWVIDVNKGDATAEEIAEYQKLMENAQLEAKSASVKEHSDFLNKMEAFTINAQADISSKPSIKKEDKKS